MNPWSQFYRAIEWMPVALQELVILAVLVAPALIVGLIVLWGYRPLPLVHSMLVRFRWSNLVFVLLIGISVGVGVGLISQEQALQEGTARAADPFDLVVSAPGSDITMLFATVYLQPSDVPLLSGAVFDAVASAEGVSLAAPIAFGDSFRSYPVVGSTGQFVQHLSGSLVEGTVFAQPHQAVVGAGVELGVGERFTPSHGVGDAAEHDAHAGAEFEVVGRMQATGSPWDRAIVVPVEAVWTVHGLPNGHAAERADQLGPPFDPAYFPGTPAILVSAEELYVNYALRNQFNTAETMAFFPGTVLASLHTLMGEVREVMSIMAVVTQVLVTAGVLSGMVILLRLFSRRIALLRALGAPARFVFSAVWLYASSLIVIGALLGIILGHVAATLISRVVTARTDILVEASLGWSEIHLIGGFVSVTMLLALLPAGLALTRSVITDLRSN